MSNTTSSSSIPSQRRTPARRSLRRAVAGATLATLVAGFTLLAAAPASAADPTWSTPPADISVVGFGTAGLDVTGFSGGVVATYTSYDGLYNHIYASKSVDGITWGTPVLVSQSLESSGGAQIVAYGTGLAMAWVTNVGGATYEAFVSTSADGTSWTTPLLISGGALADVGRVYLTAYDNGLAAMFVDTGETVVYASTSTDAITWTSPTTISSITSDVRWGSILGYGTSLAATWSYTNGPDTKARVATYTPGGGWVTGFDVSSALEGADVPKLVAVPGGLLSLWNQPGGPVKTAFFNGTAWVLPVPLFGTNTAGTSVTSFGTGAALVFGDYNGTAFGNYASTTTDGITWSTPVQLNANAATNASYQKIAEYSGGLVSTWTENDGSNDIVLASTSVDGTTWTTPVAISLTGQNATGTFPVGFLSTAAAVWPRSDGSNTRVQGAGIVPAVAAAAPGALAATGTEVIAPSLAALVLLVVGGLALAARYRRTGSTSNA